MDVLDTIFRDLYPGSNSPKLDELTSEFDRDLRDKDRVGATRALRVYSI